MLLRTAEARAAAPDLARLLLQRLLRPVRNPLPGDPTPFFTFLLLANCGHPASNLVDQARQTPGGLEPLTRFCTGLLTTEDEQVRRLAEQTLHAAAPRKRSARPRPRSDGAAG